MQRNGRNISIAVEFRRSKLAVMCTRLSFGLLSPEFLWLRPVWAPPNTVTSEARAQPRLTAALRGSVRAVSRLVHDQ